MILKQFYLNCLAHASYLIGDEASGTACVVDPQRDIEQYVTFAREHQLTIKHVILTHFHADFIAGHLELRDAIGARIYLGRAASAEYAFTPLGDGDSLEMGAVRLEALETPGHTAESISILVFDRGAAPADTPVAVLTGDTLFVGDVGRPDLRAALGWSAISLGGMLYDSLHRKLLTLPDSSLVYPAHGAGSLCGKAISQETVSTIGEQRRLNYALQPMSKEAFVQLVTADQPLAPSYFTYDAQLNSRERATLSQALARELKPLTLEGLLEAQAAGAQVLDTREASQFASGHLRGSINIGLVGQYATWAGTVLDPQKPIAIIADPGQESESAMRLGRIGLDTVIGYLDGGFRSVDARPSLIVQTERMTPERAAERLSASDRPVLVDVRSPHERDAKRIEGSLSIPGQELRERLDELPRDRPILVYCAGGYRSSLAASLMQRAGITEVAEIAGGIAGWEAAKLPIAS
jgi:glyoxylase-like metal-dependent hydrolase (beta-lactamase superfamily II)/rhodanese-related sulfurtransferase